MSPTLAGPTRADNARAGVFSGSPSQYFEDLKRSHSFGDPDHVGTFDAPMALLGDLDPDPIYASMSVDYELSAKLGALGSQIAMAFEICDSTSLRGSGLHRVGEHLGSVLHRGLQASVAVEESVAETYTTPDYDYDHPVTIAWLTNAYHAIFTPSEREDVDLGFDPDDYPVT